MHGYGDGGGRCIFSVYFRMECRHAVGLFLPRIKNIERERERKEPCIIGNRKFLIRTRVKNGCLAPQ